MRNLPYSQQWRDETHFKNQVVTLYIECPESWARAKREVNKGWPVLLLPSNKEISAYYLPVAGHEAFIIDLQGIDHSQAKKIGVALVQAGATLATYFGPDGETIFFKPETNSCAA